MKRFITLSLIAGLFIGNVYADESSIDYKPAIGWQFYNLPKEKKEKTPKAQPEQV